MSDDPLPSLKKWRISLGKFGRNKKRNSLVIIILVIATSLFFSIVFRHDAFAEKGVLTATPNPDVMDPLQRIGQGFQERLAQQGGNTQLCKVTDKVDAEAARIDSRTADYMEMVSGHPMTAMVPEIAQKDKAVAAFLIGIAKKESDWGTHSPEKDGRDCYNYWGYKGGYNVTDSGYSCFDSPAQAVDVVGARIHDLIAAHIDTPARMVVWKCGNAACLGFDQGDVQKWISDVSVYYDQAVS